MRHDSFPFMMGEASHTKRLDSKHGTSKTAVIGDHAHLHIEGNDMKLHILHGSSHATIFNQSTSTEH